MGSIVAMKIIGPLAIVCGAVIASLNWYGAYVSCRGPRHISPIPLVGGFLLCFGLLSVPAVSKYAWVGLVLDFGTVVLFLSIPGLMYQAWSLLPINLVHHFVSDAAGRRDDVRLFKNGRFTIRTEYDPPVRYDAHGALMISTGCTGTWKDESGGFALTAYRENRVLHIVESGDRYSSVEENYPDAQEYPADRLGGLTLTRVQKTSRGVYPRDSGVKRE